MEEAIVLTYDISADDFTRAGEASSDVKRKLKQMAKANASFMGTIYPVLASQVNTERISTLSIGDS